MANVQEEHEENLPNIYTRVVRDLMPVQGIVTGVYIFFILVYLSVYLSIMSACTYDVYTSQ